MDNEALLALYLEKLRIMAEERLNSKEISVLNALKESLTFLEGELTGY